MLNLKVVLSKFHSHVAEIKTGLHGVLFFSFAPSSKDDEGFHLIVDLYLGQVWANVIPLYVVLQQMYLLLHNMPSVSDMYAIITIVW